MFKSLTFELSYAVDVPEIPAKGKKIRLWLPFPRETAYQNLHSIDVDTDVDYQITYDTEFGNAILYASIDLNHRSKGFHLNVVTKATRYERKMSDPVIVDKAQVAGLQHFKAQLIENKYIKFTTEIQKLAKSLTQDKTKDAIQIAREAYEYVIDNMDYDKSGDGWGQGDTQYACQIGKGNCTDFHSLFLGILRACGIPGQFEIGVAFPAGTSEGDITFFKCGYHCWASFYVHGTGWVAADCSEAAQKPDLHDYYFGNLDENRFLMSYGRDINLIPQSGSCPQNFFTEPVVETEVGTPVYYEKKLKFRTLEPKGSLILGDIEEKISE